MKALIASSEHYLDLALECAAWATVGVTLVLVGARTRTAHWWAGVKCRR